MISINRITVGYSLPLSNRYGSECLFVWSTPEQATHVIAESPHSDGVMMCTTTYHRAATMSDVVELKYDQYGSYISDCVQS